MLHLAGMTEHHLSVRQFVGIEMISRRGRRKKLKRRTHGCADERFLEENTTQTIVYTVYDVLFMKGFIERN